jgi:hypothetical protein
MSWLTSPDEHRVQLSLTLEELRHILSALIFLNNDPALDLAALERNAMMIELLIQADVDETSKIVPEPFEDWKL